MTMFRSLMAVAAVAVIASFGSAALAGTTKSAQTAQLSADKIKEIKAECKKAHATSKSAYKACVKDKEKAAESTDGSAAAPAGGMKE